MEEVNKSGLPWPDHSLQLLSFRIFNEYLPLFALQIWSAAHLYACIYDWNNTIIFANLLQFVQRESLFINSEILEINHVVNIKP